MNKSVIRISKLAETVKKEERQAKLDAIADKQKQGKLTLEDIYEQNKIIIDLLINR